MHRGMRRLPRCSACCFQGARRCSSQVTLSQARLRDFIRAELSVFSQQRTQALTLEEIIEASTPSKVARLVHKELPFRFASRIRHIEAVEGWTKQRELVKLHEIFSESFSELRLAEPPGAEDSCLSVPELKDYTEVIRNLRKRHRPVVVLLAEAFRKMNSSETAWMKAADFQLWADTFLLGRISTEMLTQHYVAVVDSHESSASSSHSSDRIGIVDTKCNPGRICEEAAEAVQAMYKQGDESLTINVHLHSDSGSSSAIEFSYIPKYLFYIVKELISNSARATSEAKRGMDCAAALPIDVTVCADEQRVAIRISDQGGGFPLGQADEVMSYLFSTSEQPLEDYVASGSPLAPWGIGLPLGRLYALYLGGTLQLMNVPGTGVDAYLFLRRIAPCQSDWPVDRPTSISDSVAPV